VAMNLFEHNRTAYEAVAAMLAETGKAAVVHPTGTGKSFIGFKLCEDHPNQTVCWLSPSDYIFRTQLENLSDASPDTVLDNVKYFTYARLMNMTDEEIAEITPDYIVLDEFHRAGAEYWGAGVQKLLSAYPQARLLGLSATAIRYLDNQRNMADELFDGNIASEMTLGEAIVRGILNPPKYVLSIFSYQDSLVKYEMRVKKAQNKAVKDKAEKYLEALRHALDKADGLDVIFDKHMTERTGKYIIFCANYDAMLDAMGKVDEWFGKVDAAPHVYSVYSLDSTANRSFDEFRADNDASHLRLLFCIDALNEGIHVENVAGVILLRPTISPIIYKQQIGRALSASKTTVPVIFDIVNNIENLYSIDSIKEEMQIAIQYFREYDRDYDIVNDNFDVIDEVRECVELFNELEETLTASWDMMYLEAKRYYEENGDLLVPQAYINDNGYRVGQWVNVQRVNYRKKQFLSESRIRRLEAIGMDWQTADERFWNESYQNCKLYFEQHGSLEGIRTADPHLAAWLVFQRKKYKEGALSTEKIQLLEAVGMIWSFDTWEQFYEAAKRFYEQNGHLDIQVGYVTEDGLKLGRWFRTMRNMHREGTLSEKKQKLLEDIGMKWDSQIMRNWFDKYRLAKEYFEEHGNLNIKVKYIAPDGTRLGTWISTQRSHYLKGILSDEQIEMLEKIGMVWNRDDSRWEDSFRYAEKFVASGGDINSLPEDYLIDGFNLTRWIRAQRDRKKKGKISPDRITKLKKIGLQWEVYEPVWQKNFQYAQEYYLKHGDLLVPRHYECSDGFKLDTWLQNQRTKYRTGKLSDDRIEKLESIGMIWSPEELRWENGIMHAKAYFKEFGDLAVPQKYVSPDGYNLGTWLGTVRKNYRNGKLSAERIRQLECIGVVWDPIQQLWLRGYAHAEKYYQEHGGLKTGKDYVCDDGYRLGQWLVHQRQEIKTGRMKNDRLELLMKIGFMESHANCGFEHR